MTVIGWLFLLLFYDRDRIAVAFGRVFKVLGVLVLAEILFWLVVLTVVSSRT